MPHSARSGELCAGRHRIAGPNPHGRRREIDDVRPVCKR
jgi:hypothetical protein